MTSKLKSLILPIGFTVCFIWSFFAGFLIHKYAVAPSGTTPKDPSIPDSVIQEEFDIVLITNEDSPRIVFLDFVREGKKFYGKARYYNGTNWISQDLLENNVRIAEHLRSTEISNGVNYVDSTEVDLNLLIGDVKIKLFELNIPTPIAIKTRKTFTKFAGAKNSTESKLLIDNEVVDARVAILKAYNIEKDSTSEIDLGVNTYWYTFWDANGNFYHLDKSIVANPSKTYQSHDFFAILYKEANPHVDYYSDSIAVAIENINKLKVSFKDAVSTSYYEYSLSDFFERKGFDVPSRGAIIRDSSGGMGLYLDLGN